MIEDIRRKLDGYPVTVTMVKDRFVVKTTHWITDKKIFAEIAEVVKGFGGVWLKDGERSRFEIPCGSQNRQDNPAKIHLTIIRSELDKLEALL